MTCLSDIQSTLQDIAAKLTLVAGCACGSGGGPAASPAALTTNTGDITEEDGTPPDGYDNWAQYQAYKCDVATWIVNNLLDDVQWVQTQQIAAMTVGGLAAGLLGFLSAGTLLVILSVLLAILAYEFTALSDLEDAIQANFDDLVCALMSGETAAESIANFEDTLSDAVDNETADTVARALLKQLANLWVDTTSVNLMYDEYDAATAINVPTGGDCSDCGLPCNVDTINFGEAVGPNEYSSEETGGAHYIMINFNDNAGLADCSGHCGPEVEIELVSMTGWSAFSSVTDSFRIYTDDDCPFTSNNASGYSSDTQPSGGYCGRRITIFSATEFTAVITKTECA